MAEKLQVLQGTPPPARQPPPDTATLQPLLPLRGGGRGGRGGAVPGNKQQINGSAGRAMS